MNNHGSQKQQVKNNVTLGLKWNKLASKLWFRILFAVMVPALLLVPVVFLYKNGSPFKCLFYELTGLYCPGCGSGRAAYAMLHLHFVDAFGYNMLFPIASVFIGYYFSAGYLKVITGKKILPVPNLSINTYIVIMVVIIAFAVLRNINVFPFTVLAP